MRCRERSAQIQEKLTEESSPMSLRLRRPHRQRCWRYFHRVVSKLWPIILQTEFWPGKKRHSNKKLSTVWFYIFRRNWLSNRTKYKNYPSVCLWRYQQLLQYSGWTPEKLFSGCWSSFSFLML
jgi:hypothetical protein